MTQPLPERYPDHAPDADYRPVADREPDFKAFLMSAPDFGELEITRPREPAPLLDFDVEVRLHGRAMCPSVRCNLMLRSRQTGQQETEAPMALRQPDEHADGHEPRWQLQEAKQRFSEIVRLAEVDGPQIITKHGEDVVAIISIRDYREYRRMKGTKMPFNEFLMAPPYLDVDLDAEIQRSKELPRIPDFAIEDPE